MVQDKFEDKYSSGDRRDKQQSGYDESSDSEECDHKVLEDAPAVSLEILSYVEQGKSDTNVRAKLERRADSMILIAENASLGDREEISTLIFALKALRN